jgi:hypothetical protein
MREDNAIQNFSANDTDIRAHVGEGMNPCVTERAVGDLGI